MCNILRNLEICAKVGYLEPKRAEDVMCGDKHSKIQPLMLSIVFKLLKYHGRAHEPVVLTGERVEEAPLLTFSRPGYPGKRNHAL